MDGRSECVDRYKKSVITSYLNRAHRICSNNIDLNNEINYIKKMLQNNNYSLKMINYEIENFKYKKENDDSEMEKIKIYYEGQYHSNCKLDEKILKNNIRPSQLNSEIKILIYYKNKKTSNLVMANKVNSRQDALSQTNVVYEFKCPMLHNQVASYIGMTQNTLSRRLTLHLQNGSIKQHFLQHHSKELTRKELVNNTKIIENAKNRKKLLIKEALLIQEKGSTINKQFDCFPNILRLYTKLDNFPLKLNQIQPPINNEEFNDGIMLTSTPIPDTTLDYNQRLEKYVNKLNNVPQIDKKYNLRPRK